MRDNLYTKEEFLNGLLSGIKKCVSAVGVTMGTAGTNNIIESNLSPGFLVTNDGVTALESIKLVNPVEELARKMLLDAVGRANKQSGDGSSTTTVLCAAILEEGLKYIKDYSVMDIKRSLEECLPIIEEELNNQKRDITVDEVGTVATISAEDKEIGDRIQEIYQKIGKDGIIHWDISKTATDSYVIGQGITVEGGGIASPYMCDFDKESTKLLTVARLTNPQVIITKEKITSGIVFENLFIQLNNKGKKEVVIFCDDFEIQAVAHLVSTYQAQGFRGIMIKMPVLWKDQWYEDLAKASGATIIDPNAGLPIKSIKEEHLGTFGHITVDKENTYIDGIKDLSDHVKSLEEINTDDSKLRASRLNTKTARYFVGAYSESALSYRRLKVEDAISASWQALNGGIVAGGGVALHNVAVSLDPTKSVGNAILNNALNAPILQILQNARIENHSFVPFSNNGYDTRTKQQVDMFEANITDPKNIVYNAVKNAISVASTILTAPTGILIPRQENRDSGNPAMII